MHVIVVVLVLYVAVNTVSTSDSDAVNISTDIKVWSDCNSTGDCICGVHVKKAVLCTEDELWVQPCYCMYYDDTMNKTLLGNCLFTCYYFNASRVRRYYYAVTRHSIQNASAFNKEMCGPVASLIETHRTGRFCGQCEEGHGLAVYSYQFTTCIPCTEYGYRNWLKYFAAALLPLTLFYFLVVILRINITSSHLNGVIFTFQLMTSPIQMQILDGWARARTFSTPPLQKKGRFKLLHFALSIAGIVNLDFFRSLYSPFCIHPALSTLHVISLDFVIALYPFLLIFLTYVLVTLYDRGFPVLVWAWKPFKWCLRHYNKTLDVRASLIETFASFILLSNVKVLAVCFMLLTPTRTFDATGLRISPGFLFADANVEYFGAEHLPFAVLGLFMGSVFVLLPFLLLVMYPCSCFQKCLNALGFRCQLLHVFMDAFQGSYKTEPRDLRCFSAFYVLLRFLTLFVTENLISLFYVPTLANLSILSGLVIAMFEPYKIPFHNKLDIFLLLCIGITYNADMADALAFYLDWHWMDLADILFYILPIFLLLVYFLLRFPLKKLKALCCRCRRLCWSQNAGEEEKIQALIESFNREGYEAVSGFVHA